MPTQVLSAAHVPPPALFPVKAGRGWWGITALCRLRRLDGVRLDGAERSEKTAFCSRTGTGPAHRDMLSSRTGTGPLPPVKRTGTGPAHRDILPNGDRSARQVPQTGTGHNGAELRAFRPLRVGPSPISSRVEAPHTNRDRSQGRVRPEPFSGAARMGTDPIPIGTDPIPIGTGPTNGDRPHEWGQTPMAL